MRSIIRPLRTMEVQWPSADELSSADSSLRQLEFAAEMREISEWRRFRRQLTLNKPLVPLKGCMFLYYGAWSLYLPYLTLQMVQVGLSIEEIAIIYAVLPFASSIAPPIAGLLADKFDRYKLLLIGSVALAGVFHSFLLHIDARSESPANAFNSSVSTSGELLCNRTGSFVRFASNESICGRQEGELQVSASWRPFQCETWCQHPRMKLCHQHNCTNVELNSTGELAAHLQLEEIEIWRQNCATRIGRVMTGPDGATSTLLCNCNAKCPIQIESDRTAGQSAASNSSDAERMKHLRGFGIYFAVRILASMSLSTSLSMLDATAICMVKMYNGDLGKQRIFGVVGQAVMAMIAGILLDWTVSIKGFPDYSVVFYMADALFVVVIVLVSRLDVAVEKVEGQVGANFKKLIRLVDVNVFLVMMLFLGACWGFLESYLFVYLMEMEASSYLLGMTVTLGCVIGLPFLYVSDTLVHKVGEINLIIVAFFIYSVRFVGYSFITDPWLCLPLEALEAVTVHLMAVASSIYCSKAAPPGTLATLNGAVGSFHYSFGRGLGSFVGGILMAQFGTRATFQFFGMASGVLGVVYLAMHRFYLVKLERLRTRRKSEHIAAVLAAGGTVEDEEPDEPFIIPPDNLMGRRMSCF